MSKSLTHTTPVPEIKDNAMLEINTYGSRGRIWSVAKIYYKESLSGGIVSKSYTIFGDWKRDLAKTTVSRVSKKAIEAHHNEAIKKVEELKLEAIEFYIEKANAENIETDSTSAVSV